MPKNRSIIVVIPCPPAPGCVWALRRLYPVRPAEPYPADIGALRSRINLRFRQSPVESFEMQRAPATAANVIIPARTHLIGSRIGKQLPVLEPRGFGLGPDPVSLA